MGSCCFKSTEDDYTYISYDSENPPIRKKGTDYRPPNYAESNVIYDSSVPSPGTLKRTNTIDYMNY